MYLRLGLFVLVAMCGRAWHATGHLGVSLFRRPPLPLPPKKKTQTPFGVPSTLKKHEEGVHTLKKRRNIWMA